MAITTVANSLKAALDGATPATLPDLLRTIKFGSVLRALPTYLFKQVPPAAATNPYVVAAGQSITLPDDAKAIAPLFAFPRTGTGTVDVQLVNDIMAATEPSAGHIKISPTGDILLNHTDAWTSIDVVYLPAKYDVYEFTLPCVASLLTWPSTAGAGVLLMEAEALTGTVTGKKIVDLPGTSSATGHASFNAAMTAVQFNNGTDVVTSARVKIGVVPSTDVNALLEALTNIL